MCYTQCAQIEETRLEYRAEVARLECSRDAADAYEVGNLRLLHTIYANLLESGEVNTRYCLALLSEAAKPETMFRLFFMRLIGRDLYATTAMVELERRLNVELEAVVVQRVPGESSGKDSTMA